MESKFHSDLLDLLRGAITEAETADAAGRANGYSDAVTALTHAIGLTISFASAGDDDLVRRLFAKTVDSALEFAIENNEGLRLAMANPEEIA